jgi:hypothetical protein
MSACVDSNAIAATSRAGRSGGISDMLHGQVLIKGEVFDSKDAGTDFWPQKGAQTPGRQ